MKYPKIGDTIRVRFPYVDQARSAGRNVLAIVNEIIASHLCELGTKQKVLNQLYSRNTFTLVDVLETEISLKEYQENVQLWRARL